MFNSIQENFMYHRYRAVAFALAAATAFSAPAFANHHNHPNEIQQDRQEIRKDKREIREDKRELRKDRIEGDRKEFREDRKELREDKKELHEDAKETREDIKERREDRREHRREKHEHLKQACAGGDKRACGILDNWKEHHNAVKERRENHKPN